MAASFTEVQAKFTADITDFKAGAEAISREIGKLSEGFAALGRAGKDQLAKALDTAKIQKGFEALSTFGIKPTVDGFAELGKAGRLQLDKALEITKLQQGFANLNTFGLIPVGEGLANVGLHGEVSGTKVKRALSEVGQVARHISPFIGGLAGDFLLFGGDAIRVTKSLISEMVSLIHPVALIGAAAFAAGAAFLYFSGQMSHSAAEAAVAAGTIDGLKAKLVELQEKAKQAKINLKELDAPYQRDINLPSSSPGGGAGVTLSVAAAKARATNEVLKAESDILKTQLDIVGKQLEDELQRLSLIYDNGGDKFEYLTGKVAAYGQAVDAASKIEGVSADTIRNLVKSHQASIQTLDEEKDSFQELSDAIEEQEAAYARLFAKKERDAQRDKQRFQFTKENFKEFTDSFKVTAQDVYGSIQGLYDSLIGGIAQSLTQLLIYGKTSADILVGVFSAATSAFIELAIKSFIEIAAQFISHIILGNIAAYSAVPFVGLALGLAGAAAAIAGARGLASSSGGHAFAEGGIVTKPVLGLVGEAGPEAIMPLSKVGDFLGGGGGMIQNIAVYLDGRVISRTAARGMPRELRLHGVKGI